MAVLLVRVRSHVEEGEARLYEASDDGGIGKLI